jgi:hypothetical protein
MSGLRRRVTYVTNGSFHATFLVTAGYRDKSWFVTILSDEGRQRRMKADRVAASFEYRTLKVVVQQNARYARLGGKGGDVAAQKTVHPRVRKEAEKNLPRVTEHHDERHQRALRAADLQMSEVSPVDLALFTGQDREIHKMRLSGRDCCAHEAGNTGFSGIFPQPAKGRPFAAAWHHGPENVGRTLLVSL